MFTAILTSSILCVATHTQYAVAYTTIHQTSAGTATLKLAEWIQFTKRDVMNRMEAVTELPTLYTMAGSMYRASLKGADRMVPRNRNIVAPILWEQHDVGDEIIVMADETIPVPFSVDELTMTTDTYIGKCEICAGNDGKKVVTLRQLVAHPNLRFIQDSFQGSPENGYGVAFKHALVESVTDAGLTVNIRPLVTWGDGRHFLHLNEDVLF
jgi:hypothetical protein